MLRGVLLLLTGLLAVSVQAQSFTDGFSFYMPPYQDGHGRFLPDFPATPIGAQAFVEAGGEGQFLVGGTPVRFFGTNVTAGACFPVRERAPGIAARLRTFGYNLLRFHFLDNNWGITSLFTPGQGTRQFNPEMLDRFTFFLHQLRQNGIYANINLHVGRTVTAADGIPDADQLPGFGKGVFLFDPALIALQKEHAQALLEYVSPYSGVALKDDPVVGMIEITNENSLFFFWRNNDLKPFAEGGALTPRHAALLDAQWNRYLLDTYGTTAALRAAWAQEASAPGNQISDPGFETSGARWELEQHGGAQASWARQTEQVFDGRQAAKVTIGTPGADTWHVQFKRTGLSVEQGGRYTATFAARADTERSVTVTMMRDTAPWTLYGGFEIDLTPTWQTFSHTFIAPETADGLVRLSFNHGTQTGTLWVDEVRFGTAGALGLDDAERLETASVRRTDFSETRAVSPARMQDMTAFYIELERAYYREMHTFLTDTLGVRVPISGTNWYMGLPAMAVQDQMDYLDNHAYWDHPSFPNQAWDFNDWLIDNTPMVRDPADNTITQLMGGVAHPDKPYTISEYNHPFPNRYQAEAPLFLTAYSAVQGVDGLMFYLYHQYGGAGSDALWEDDQVTDFFRMHRDPTMMALMPTLAHVYRTGLIQEDDDPVRLRFAPETVRSWPASPSSGQFFSGIRDFVHPSHILTRRFVTDSFEASEETDFSVYQRPLPGPYRTQTGEITWDPEGGTLIVATDRFIAKTGFLDQMSPSEAPGFLTLTGDDFGTVTWLSLTDADLYQARRSIFTLASRTQNEGMRWAGTRTLGGQWGTAPTAVAPLRVTARFPLFADSIRVYPLDETGQETGIYTTYRSTDNTFEIVLDQSETPTPWFGVEAFGEGLALSNEPTERPGHARLVVDGNHPNPFTASTTLRFTTPHAGDVTIRVFDLLGREVYTDTIHRPHGPQRYRLEGTSWPSGVYTVRLETGAHAVHRPVLIVR
ncbi:MAG: carbohydrate binding domain-containing protein [Bacteroidota bacterium]